MKLTIEIPDELGALLETYLSVHTTWQQDEVATAGLALFLLQTGSSDRRASRIYLDTLFKRGRGHAV